MGMTNFQVYKCSFFPNIFSQIYETIKMNMDSKKFVEYKK